MNAVDNTRLALAAVSVVGLHVVDVWLAVLFFSAWCYRFMLCAVWQTGPKLDGATEGEYGVCDGLTQTQNNLFVTQQQKTHTHVTKIYKYIIIYVVRIRRPALRSMLIAIMQATS